jgi:hypothetical protein
MVETKHKKPTIDDLELSQKPNLRNYNPTPFLRSSSRIEQENSLPRLHMINSTNINQSLNIESRRYTNKSVNLASKFRLNHLSKNNYDLQSMDLPRNSMITDKSLLYII